jgi:molecular chaperone GrpE
VDRRHHAAESSAPTETVAPAGSAVDAPPSPEPPSGRDEEVAQLNARIDELARAYARSIEDQKEFRTRFARENERVLAGERIEVARALIETVDDLDRSLSAADASPLATGVRVIRDAIVKRLSTMGVERIALVGKPFDPNLSEAIGLVEVADPAMEDSVVEELAAGYRAGDRVVRPGKVRVGRAPTASA